MIEMIQHAIGAFQPCNEACHKIGGLTKCDDNISIFI